MGIDACFESVLMFLRKQNVVFYTTVLILKTPPLKSIDKK